MAVSHGWRGWGGYRSTSNVAIAVFLARCLSHRFLHLFLHLFSLCYSDALSEIQY